MVVPRWSPLRLASAALAVLFLPLVAATPEVRDPSEATVFVDGDSDYFELDGLGLAFFGQSLTITAPDGTSAVLLYIGTTSQGATSFYLDGSPRSGATASFVWSGDLSGAAADGTWVARSGYIDSSDSPFPGSAPGPTLSVQGKAIHWGIQSENPLTFTQVWNWHRTTGTWNEPSTVPVAATSITDTLNEGPEEDPQYSRFFVPGGGPMSQSLPGFSDSETAPGQDVNTPPFTIPATCTLNPCNAETPLVTPAQPVPRTCAPLEVFCIGPFTVPPQDFGDAPAVCDVAGDICVGPIPVPAQDVVETNAITVSVVFTGLDLLADPHAAELTSIGPFHEDIPVPLIGDVPVDVCASTCPFPVSPEGETVGSLTITVTVGSESESVTIPLGQSL